MYFAYQVYDHLIFWFYKKKRVFPGWGIHLFTGKFGQGKTSLMTIEAYKLCVRYPQLHVLTNIELTNFPAHTKIIPLKTAQDILNAPRNTLVLKYGLRNAVFSRAKVAGVEQSSYLVNEHKRTRICVTNKKLHVAQMARIRG